MLLLLTLVSPRGVFYLLYCSPCTPMHFNQQRELLNSLILQIDYSCIEWFISNNNDELSYKESVANFTSQCDRNKLLLITDKLLIGLEINERLSSL